MTAPTPSSGSDGPRYDPWAKHPSTGPRPPGGAAGRNGDAHPSGGAAGHGSAPFGPGPFGGPGEAPAADPARAAREGVLVALGVAAFGVVLGLLWLWLAPRVPLVSDGSAVFLERPEGEDAIGADGTFVLLGVAVGAVAGAVVFLLRRAGGVGLVVGLAVGGVLGSVIAWRLGVWLGPTEDLVAHARAVGKGTVFDGPLELKAKGALLAYPFGALLAHLACTALFGRRDPEPVGPAPWGPPPPPPAR
ncbi:hypothetical protein RM572_20385 [Streptomyces sp. DSM 42041]|uniref:ABC transporter permease n=1 Tax=Streptomyces hazeniae TaxID=3075538 RepID=A0ABU2NVU7_9ACTN|nr:hypothetical protein [Streptomyces sp. DSM 42041]MDT0381117.1 hypothetical protein [Streptomyces sp. DSM 42041]